MTLTVSEAATKVGLSAYTLRWYEQEGLVDRVDRDSAGRRRYSEEDVDWLRDADPAAADRDAGARHAPLRGARPPR